MNSTKQLMKASNVPILGILGYVIVYWDKKKTKKNGNFWFEKLLNRLWFVIFEHTINHLSLGYIGNYPSRDQNFTGQKWAESGRY